jgi:hypothetical protein
MLRLSNIRVAIKLAAMSAIAILLVAGMTIMQRMNGDSVVIQNAAQDQAQSVRSKLKDAQAAILRTWVARRDGLLADAIPAIDKALAALKSNLALGVDKLDGAGKALVTAADREGVQ